MMSYQIDRKEVEADDLKEPHQGQGLPCFRLVEQTKKRDDISNIALTGRKRPPNLPITHIFRTRD